MSNNSTLNAAIEKIEDEIAKVPELQILSQNAGRRQRGGGILDVLKVTIKGLLWPISKLFTGFLFVGKKAISLATFNNLTRAVKAVFFFVMLLLLAVLAFFAYNKPGWTALFTLLLANMYAWVKCSLDPVCRANRAKLAAQQAAMEKAARDFASKVRWFEWAGLPAWMAGGGMRGGEEPEMPSLSSLWELAQGLATVSETSDVPFETVTSMLEAVKIPVMEGKTPEETTHHILEKIVDKAFEQDEEAQNETENAANRNAAALEEESQRQAAWGGPGNGENGQTQFGWGGKRTRRNRRNRKSKKSRSNRK